MPAPGAAEPADEEGNEDLVAPATLPNTLPVPIVRMGTETATVVFLTDSMLHSIFTQYVRARGGIHDTGLDGWLRHFAIGT